MPQNPRVGVVTCGCVEQHRPSFAGCLSWLHEHHDDASKRAAQTVLNDAEVLIVACNTPARMAKGAVEVLRREGIRAGLFRPITLWPFPIDALREPLEKAKRLIVVEASAGQLQDELRLAMSKAGIYKADRGDGSHVRR